MCRHNRDRLCQELLAGGLVYVSAGDLQHRNGPDVYFKFRPSSDYAYLAGAASDPGLAVLLEPDTRRCTLVAPRLPDDAAVWWGGLPALDELAELAGADDCIYAGDLPAYVRRRLKAAGEGGGGSALHVLEQDEPEQQRLLLRSAAAKRHQPLALQHAAALAELHESGDAQFTSAFLDGALRRCREAKSAAEVGCLLEASRGSAAAHRALWAACRPGAREYQLEAAFVAEAARRGLTALGYPCIVGAGRNAAVLHYERNAAAAAAGDLVLVDAGAEFRHYTADITRTCPASGSFTAAQRDVYGAVLRLQRHALGLLAPGAAWADVQASTRRLLLDELLQLGLLRGGRSLDELSALGVDKVFMPHGLGHHLGLDVHDVGAEGPVPQALREGHVVTVEPGIYFMPLLLQRAAADPKQAACINMPAAEAMAASVCGVRIEDNVLITAGGHFNLTEAAGLPKEARDVEAAMAAGGGS